MAATVTLAGLEISGSAVSGIGTYLTVPEYRLGLDLGLTREETLPMSTVLITHSHIDHLGAICWHADARGLLGMKRPRYVVPPSVAAPLDALFAAWDTLQSGNRFPHEIVPLGPGEELTLPRGLKVRPFETYHRGVSQGYALWRTVRKLRPEFVGLPGEQIRQLRAAEGVQVTEQREVLELCYTGDTTADVLQHEEVRTARRLIMEATFLDDKVTVEHARKLGHLHLDELAARADELENEAILLMHFSARYGDKAITRALDRALPQELRDRVMALLPGDR